jgi:hypothetical protein
MSDDGSDSNKPAGVTDEKGAGEELREGLRHLFSAARKVMQTAEPTVNHALDDAERVFDKLGRGGAAVAGEVGKEVATLATKLADRLKTVANRIDGNVPDERTPPEPGGEDESKKP